MLTQAEGEKLQGRLAFQAAETTIKAFLGRILKAIKNKNLTLGKILQIYTVVEHAVKSIEAIVNSK